MQGTLCKPVQASNLKFFFTTWFKYYSALKPVRTPKRRQWSNSSPAASEHMNLLLIKMTPWNVLLTVPILISCSSVLGIREYKKEDILQLREEVREMFTYAYDSYLRHAYPADELRPLSCDGVDTWGSYSLTLVDALDTLAIMGNYTEFKRVVPLVLKRKKYDSDINVSVFETNIRIIGGLLSAHLLSHKAGLELEPGWPCNGPLLRLAEDVAQRLIVAFDTKTGMPYGTVNLRSGVPRGETTVTCTAGVGTFLVEFGTLSRLTGDPLYEEVAYNAMMALYNHRSSIGLLGNHVDVMTGRWTAQDAGIGGGVDSYFEYLVKGAILLEKPELMSMFNEARQVVDQYLKKEDWYVWATMLKGQVTVPVFQSLEAYWPGVLSLIGDTDTAMRIMHNYHSVWRQYGFTPEVYSLGAGEAASARESYPLRPELAESIMYLYRDTRDPVLLQMGEDILRSIQHSARTHCGYATIKDVRDHRKEDRMESFFLAETTKYLYLLFDPDNFIHNPGVEGTLINTPNGECLVDLGGYIFNTEAHPIDPAMLYCCHEARNGLNLTEVQRMYQILEDEDNIKFKTLEETKEELLNKQQNNITNAETQYNVSDIDLLLRKPVTYRDRNLDLITLEQSSVEMNPQPKTEHMDKNINVLLHKPITYRNRNLDLITLDQSKPEIRTETRAGYVNIDGSEREKAKSTSDISSIFKENKMEQLNSNYVDTMKPSNAVSDLGNTTSPTVEVDEIIVPAKKPDVGKLRPPSANKAKEVFKMLPVVLQEFLSNNSGTKSECEPQHMLERMRKERRYAEHPHTNRYELLLTPAPSFMQRISLAGEFLNKKQLEV